MKKEKYIKFIVKLFLTLSLILFLPLNVYSKIIELNNCIYSKETAQEVFPEKSSMRDMVIKIDLINKKLTYKGYAAYTDAYQIKDELLLYQWDIIFTAIDDNFITMEKNPETNSDLIIYTVDLKKNIFQLKKIWMTLPDSEPSFRSWVCENNNLNEVTPEQKGAGSKNILKKILK